MGIVQTALLDATDKASELKYWAELLGMEINELVEELGQ